ncbi:MAG: SPOR domain-containing protein [Magnetococcales bacterium]|nr:SPOR domain-containing protein [Magnetococcales bacterium]
MNQDPFSFEDEPSQNPKLADDPMETLVAEVEEETFYLPTKPTADRLSDHRGGSVDERRSVWGRLVQTRRPIWEMFVTIPVAVLAGYHLKSLSIPSMEELFSTPTAPTIQIETVQPRMVVAPAVPSQERAIATTASAQTTLLEVKETSPQGVTVPTLPVESVTSAVSVAPVVPVTPVAALPEKKPAKLIAEEMAELARVAMEKKSRNSEQFAESMVVPAPHRKLEIGAYLVSDQQVASIVIPLPRKRGEMVVPAPLSRLLGRLAEKEAPLQGGEHQAVAAPAPIKKRVTHAMEAPPRKRGEMATNLDPVKKLSQSGVQSDHSQLRGFVLFLGSYRQAKSSYLKAISENLKQEAVNLIQQTIQFEDESYTRLYIGPFASREEAIVAKKALFDSQKIKSSVTYLQPGTSQFSQVKPIGSPIQFAQVSTPRKSLHAPQSQKYVVHLGSYQNVGVDSSGNLLKKITELGGVGFQKGTQIKGTTYWRVYSGPYYTITQATEAKNNLKRRLNLSNATLMTEGDKEGWIKVEGYSQLKPNLDNG